MQLKSNDFALAVGSSAPRVNIDFIMESIAIADMFDAIIGSEDTTKSKPDPDTFLQAADRLGLKPERCVVVEDAVAGVEAAKAAHMAVVAVTNTCSRGLLTKANMIVDSLSQLGTRDFEELLLR